jgi:hypothetical protein
MAPYQGPRGQNTQGLRHKHLGIQPPPDQERAFWREEIRKVVTYRNAAPGEEEPDTQARILAPITKIESDLKEVRTLISADRPRQYSLHGARQAIYPWRALA